MRVSTMATLLVAGLTLSGCSQISSLWKGSSKTATTSQQDTSLRTTPDQFYAFGDATTSIPNFAGYDVILYESAVRQQAVFTDPREAAFVRLNGQSQATDWRNCESQHRGYLYLSEYDFRLDPNFEVCMRNKGYVLTTEAGYFDSNPISAKTAGLRGYSSPNFTQSYSPSYP